MSKKTNITDCPMCGDTFPIEKMNEFEGKFEGIYYDLICDTCWETIFGEKLCK